MNDGERQALSAELSRLNADLRAAHETVERVKRDINALVAEWAQTEDTGGLVEEFTRRAMEAFPDVATCDVSVRISLYRSEWVGRVEAPHAHGCALSETAIPSTAFGYGLDPRAALEGALTKLIAEREEFENDRR